MDKKLLIKNFIMIICLSLINILIMPFISSFIHELSHFIMAKIFGFSDVRLIVYYPYGGNTTFKFPMIIPLDDPRVEQFRIIIIAGSLGAFIFALLINVLITFYKKLRFSIYFPFFASTFAIMFLEIMYWFNGVYIESLDAYEFINITPQVNPEELRSFLIIICIVISIYLIFVLILKYNYMLKKYEIKMKLDLKIISLVFLVLYFLLMFLAFLGFIYNTNTLFFISFS